MLPTMTETVFFVVYAASRQESNGSWSNIFANTESGAGVNFWSRSGVGVKKFRLRSFWLVLLFLTKLEAGNLLGETPKNAFLCIFTWKYVMFTFMIRDHGRRQRGAGGRGPSGFSNMVQIQ